MEGHAEVTLVEVSETDYYLERAAALEAQQLQNETAVAELSILLSTLMGGTN